ncbi:TSUP family transporter [Pseudomonas amygdali]|nr:TSUP family transporter [Pseudomonas amygdali]
MDLDSKQCALIDSVLDYDPKSGRTRTESADRMIGRVQALGASVQWIFETHVHADHLTAAPYLKQQLGGQIGYIASIGVLMAPLGLWLAHRLPNTPLALVFSVVLLYACTRMFIRASRELRHGQPPPRAEMLPCVLNPLQGRLRWTMPCLRALTLTGVGSGLLSGLLGVGGGFVIIPALTRYSDLGMKSVVATSLAVIALVSTGSVITASLSGVMHWTVGAPFALGAVIGLIVGRQVARYLAGPRLQQLFAVCGIVAAFMLALSVR